MCVSLNYCPNLSTADIGAKNQIRNFDRGVPLFASIPYQGFLRLKVSINCNKLKTHSPVWCRSLEVSEPSGSFPVLNRTCQNLYFLEKLLKLDVSDWCKHVDLNSFHGRGRGETFTLISVVPPTPPFVWQLHETEFYIFSLISTILLGLVLNLKMFSTNVLVTFFEGINKA